MLWVLPVCTDAVAGFIAMATGGGVVIVIVATAVLVTSATDLAVSVTVAGVGTLAGAVNVIAAPDALDAADSVPQAAAVHPEPLSAHVTPLFWASFCTVAVMLWVLPVCTEALVGDTETAIVVAPAITVTCAVSITVDCACEIAAMVIAAGEGTAAGAVYVPFASMVPCVVSPPATPFTCHVTAVLGVFATAAVNFSVVET